MDFTNQSINEIKTSKAAEQQETKQKSGKAEDSSLKNQERQEVVKRHDKI